MLLYATYVTNLARLPLLIKGQSYDITYYIITQWCKDEVRLLGVCRHFKQFFIEISWLPYVIEVIIWNSYNELICEPLSRGRGKVSVTLSNNLDI